MACGKHGRGALTISHGFLTRSGIVEEIRSRPDFRIKGLVWEMGSSLAIMTVTEHVVGVNGVDPIQKTVVITFLCVGKNGPLQGFLGSLSSTPPFGVEED